MDTANTAGTMPLLQGMTPLLQVFDMAASLRFFRDILRFQLVSASAESDDADWVLLRLGTTELMLNTAYEAATRPSHPDADRFAAHSDTTLYFGCSNVDQAYRYLKQNGIAVAEPAITGYGWKAIEFSDPDGYRICLHWPQSAAADAP